MASSETFTGLASEADCLFFVSRYLRDRRFRVRIGTTLSDEFYPEESVPTGGVHREISTAGSECHTGMGDKECLQVCSPQMQSHTFHLTMVLGSETPTCVRFCWVPSHCGIEWNEIVDQLAKETLDHDIDPLTTVHLADLKPLVNSYIQQEVQIKWDVSIHGRDLYLLKPTLGPPKRFRHLTRAEEVVITRLRIGHTKATKSHILSRGPPTACQHCGQTLTIQSNPIQYTSASGGVNKIPWAVVGLAPLI